MSAPTYRYPGVRPFEASEATLFFGRDRDADDLLSLLRRERLVVLFAKSGYGKSSLLKARIMPRLVDEPQVELDENSGEEKTIPNVPIAIRFGTYSGPRLVEEAVLVSPDKPMEAWLNPTPCGKLLQYFGGAFAGQKDDPALVNFLIKPNEVPTLWERFKISTATQNQRIVLIFDQFEEFFSYPPEQQLEFRRQLGELLYAQIPQSVRDRMGSLDRATRQRLHAPLDVRVLFSIRDDRLSLLNSLHAELPAVRQVQYELKALSPSQAEAAITGPARARGAHFALPEPFGFAPAALAQILTALQTSSIPGEEGQAIETGIEAFQLQMVCKKIERTLEERQQREGRQPSEVTLADLPDFEKVYEEYYEDIIAQYPEHARLLLEEELIIGEDLGSARRLSMDRDALREAMQQNYGIALDAQLFDRLENDFLLRREQFGPRTHYEISHDTLLAPMLKSRTRRRETEASQEEEKRRLAAEKLAAEERARREEAERMQQAAELAQQKAELAQAEAQQQRNRAVRFTRLAFGVSVLALVLAAAAGWSYRQAAQASAEARVETYQAKLSTAYFIRGEGRYTEALAALDQARPFANSEQIPTLDTLQQQWRQVQHLTIEADTLLARGELRGGLDKYRQAYNITHSSRLHTKVEILEKELNLQFERYHQAAEGLLIGGARHREIACNYLRQALLLKPDDPEVLEKARNMGCVK